MGKKKDKKDSKRQGNFNRGLMSKFYGPGKEAQDMLDRYGVEGGRISRADMQSYDRTKNRSADDVRKDLYEAMSNDYDTRRSIEAAAMAGNKDAKRLAKNGFDQDSLYEAYDVMKDLKKEYVGGGGMRGAKNEAGLTYAAVKADREAQTASYDEKYASQDFLNKKLDEMQDKFKSQPKADEPIEYEYSPEVQAAQERLSDWYV